MIVFLVDENCNTSFPDTKIRGAYMGPTWGRQDPGGPHVGFHEPCYQGFYQGQPAACFGWIHTNSVELIADPFVKATASQDCGS